MICVYGFVKLQRIPIFSYLKKNGKIESIDEAKFQNIANPNDFIDEQVNTQEEAAQLRKILHSISEPYKECFHVACLWGIII